MYTLIKSKEKQGGNNGVRVLTSPLNLKYMKISRDRNSILEIGGKITIEEQLGWKSHK